MRIELEPKKLEALRRAVSRNPQVVLQEVKRFLTRGIAVYNRGILREPWRIGGSGGGAPVDTGHLRDTHTKVIETWEARILPNLSAAPYVEWVHEGTHKMEARPYLDYVKQSKDSEIQVEEKGLLDRIIGDLIK